MIYDHFADPSKLTCKFLCSSKSGSDGHLHEPDPSSCLLLAQVKGMKGRCGRSWGLTMGKPQENYGKMVVFMGIYGIYHLVMTNIAMKKSPFRVSFPIHNGDLPQLCLITRGQTLKIHLIVGDLEESCVKMYLENHQFSLTFHFLVGNTD